MPKQELVRIKLVLRVRRGTVTLDQLRSYIAALDSVVDEAAYVSAIGAYFDLTGDVLF